MPQIHPPYPDPLEPRHVQTDLLTHAANLAFFTFFQYESQLLRVLPADLCRAQRLAVQTQAMVKQPELLARKDG